MHLVAVKSVRGLDPNWRDELHIYVGRRTYLRSGPFAGATWPQSSLGNPFRGHRAVEDFAEWIRTSDALHAWHARGSFLEIARQQSAGLQIVLGCWCGDWDGRPETVKPYCHAAWLAEQLNSRPAWLADLARKGVR